MGHLEQFGQWTFAEETEQITGGGAGWQDPPEIRLEKVQADGYLVIRRPDLLERLGAPWSEARSHTEVMLELKMAGNHLDRNQINRALLRRLVREVQRGEEQDDSWSGEEPLWLVAPHLPAWAQKVYSPVRFAPGCYRIEPQWCGFLWIAANELPLRDELVPFLTARSGQALDEFGRWVAPRRRLEWVMNMIEYLPMSMPTREELLQKFGKVDDPEIEARRQRILEVLLEASPQTKQQLITQGLMEGRQEGRLAEARAALRSVLELRQLARSERDDARIDACTDLATLQRWLARAVTAASVSDALDS